MAKSEFVLYHKIKLNFPVYPIKYSRIWKLFQAKDTDSC
jgi:hypothetical protein